MLTIAVFLIGAVAGFIIGRIIMNQRILRITRGYLDGTYRVEEKDHDGTMGA